MGELPNITQTELAVLAAAVSLLFIAPGLLFWSDERRRRKAQRAAAMAEAANAAATALATESIAPVRDDLVTDYRVAAAAPPDTDDIPAREPLGTAAPVALDATTAPLAATEAPGAPEALAPRSDEAAVELLPLSGSARHRFRLDDLHAAQLMDWPPEAIRNDAERSRLRQEAEQAAAAYSARVNAASIASPYPARSHCLGAAAADASELRLSFLLFPMLWPVSQNQAVAQAVFRIDRGTGQIRGWVDALRPQELSNENRRDIRDAGGEI